MILSDGRIKELILRGELIEDYELARARYCGYELRLGKVFMPESGEAQWVEGNEAGLLLRVKRAVVRVFRGPVFTVASAGWAVGPAETLVVETRETVKIPANLCATYGQLNRLARRGLMLVNASIVEPGYQGPLSCVLVNFSSERITLFPNRPIAKIYFYTIDGDPEVLQGSVPRSRYEEELAEHARKLPKSFLDITGVEERVTERMRTVIRQGVTFAGIFIALLLLWSQLEPLLSNWLWKRTGLISSSKQMEVELQRKDLEAQRRILSLEAEKERLLTRLTDLERKVKTLQEVRGVKSGADR